MANSREKHSDMKAHKAAWRKLLLAQEYQTKKFIARWFW
jgi:hypothetical protein